MSTAKKAEEMQEKTEKKTVPAKAKEKRTMVYIGPTIPGTVISGTIFNNGYPEKLKKAVEEKKALSMLLVPVYELAKARQDLKVSGSVLQVCYKKVEEER